MFCKECGCEIPEGSLFCMECGTPVNDGYAENTEDSVTEVVQRDEIPSENIRSQSTETVQFPETTQESCLESKTGKKSKKGLLVLVVLLCVLLIGGVIAVVVISNDPERIQKEYDEMIEERTKQAWEEMQKEMEQEQSSETSMETQQPEETVLFGDTQQPEENGQAEVEQNTEFPEAEEQVSNDTESSGEVVLFRGDNYDENYEERIEDDDHDDEEAEAASEQEDYLLPDSDKRMISKKELEGFDAEQCRIARNEIYARHGRKFKDQELQEYFDSCDWYEGTVEADKFQDSVLNDYEVANRDTIVKYEKEKGYR